MKRLILTAALALTSTLAFAQQPATPDAQQPAPVVRQHAPNPQKQAAHMAKELNLTTDQAAKIEPILADRDQKVAALRSDTTLDDKTRKKQMHAIEKDSQTQFASVLTPDQLQQMKAMHHGHEKGGEQPLTPPPTNN